ncbi:hypothetical protein Hanom_Chr08g00728901 [Helianthus anomalus]
MKNTRMELISVTAKVYELMVLKVLNLVTVLQCSPFLNCLQTVMSCFAELTKVGADAVVSAFVAADGSPACMTSAAVADQTVVDPNPVEQNEGYNLYDEGARNHLGTHSERPSFQCQVVTPLI